MRGNIYINGTDVYERYGVYMTGSSLPSIFQWPVSKTIDTNDWTEEEGIEADLSELRLSSREIQITFGFDQTSIVNITKFSELLKSTKSLEMRFVRLGITLNLRLVSLSSFTRVEGMSSVIGTFSQDSGILDGYIYSSPVSSIKDSYDYLLDGRMLSKYGLITLEGTRDSILMRYTGKTLLNRDLSVFNGLTYDDNPHDVYHTDTGLWSQSSSEQGAFRCKGEELSLNCALIASSPLQAWKNSLALLHDLTTSRDNEIDLTRRCMHVLHVAANNTDYNIYYKSQTVNDVIVFPDNITWIKMELILQQI